jgi:hypothetical protein
MENQLPLTFLLSFCRDKIPGKGEDSYCHSFCDSAGMIAVFDGCGGAGARTHDYYSGKTEAYMASRLCAGAFYDLFRSHFPAQKDIASFVRDVLQPATVGQLVRFQPPKIPGAIQIRGSMVRTLPTTAAAALVQAQPDGSVKVGAAWAGDSRVYILDSKGLAQLTVDDATVTDPMLNIYEDGILKNIFSSDRPMHLNYREIVVQPPFMVLSATDGCYGYVTTPMEFEGLLLRTMAAAQNVDQWEQTLADTIGSFAGDDHALCLAAFGYDSFEALKSSFRDRARHLWNAYIQPVQDLPPDRKEPRFALWEDYKHDYLRYQKDGQI